MTNTGLSGLKGSPKDHKTGWDLVVGPPMRPTCNAALGPNAGLGNLTALILKPLRIHIAKEAKTKVCSTEELLWEIQNLN